MPKQPSTQRSLSQVSLHDLEVFLEVAKTQSIRETARRFSSEAGQISRLMRRLESKIGARLIERTPTGVSLTHHGTSALKIAQSILREAAELTEFGSADERAKIFGIGSVSFLSARLLASVVGGLTRQDESLQMRLIDVAPDQIISLALRGAYDLAVHVGPKDWPRSWQARELGELRWHLFARKGLGLPARCSVQALKAYPFILPIYWTNEGLVEGDDQCPLKIGQRKRGVSTATAETAFAVLKSSDQLAFLPEILARDAVERGEIVQIHVREWKPVTRPIYLAVRTEAVPNRLFESLAKAIASAL